MNMKQFKNELRLYGIKHDAWGTAMDAFFECAGRMNRRGLDIPVEWNYNPGMSDGTTPDSYWYSLFARCGHKQLAIIGAFLNRYTDLLRRAGRSY